MASYLEAEGTRSLPEWMDTNPFTPDGTGPMVSKTVEVADVPVLKSSAVSDSVGAIAPVAYEVVPTFVQAS